MPRLRVSRAAVIVMVVAALASLSLLGLYLAHQPPEGGRNLLTVESPVSIERFEIADSAGNVLWRITSNPARHASSIHYGEVPVGFTQVVPESGHPRPFKTNEALRTLTLTTDWQFSHDGVAIGPDRFLGGSYENGPREASSAPKAGV